MARKKKSIAVNGLVSAVVDGGNGSNEVFVAGEQYELPSVCSLTDGDTLGMGVDFERNITYFDWKGHRYMAGFDVLKTLAVAPEHHLGQDRYGGDLQQRLIAYCLAQAGVGTPDANRVDLTLLAPPGLYKKLKPQIIDRFRAAGPVSIRLKGEAEPREWVYDQIRVLPEGPIAMMAIAFDKMGKPTGTHDLDGLTLGVDSGTFTMNIFAAFDGILDMERISIATQKDAGLDRRVRQPALKWVQSLSNDFSMATIDHVDEAMRDPNHILRVAGFEVSIADVLADLGDQYAKWLISFIDTHFSGADSFSHILLIGGGALLIEDSFRRRFGDKVIKTKIHPVWLNAEGAYRYRMAQLAGKMR